MRLFTYTVIFWKNHGAKNSTPGPKKRIHFLHSESYHGDWREHQWGAGAVTIDAWHRGRCDSQMCNEHNPYDIPFC